MSRREYETPMAVPTRSVEREQYSYRGTSNVTFLYEIWNLSVLIMDIVVEWEIDFSGIDSFLLLLEISKNRAESICQVSSAPHGTFSRVIISLIVLQGQVTKSCWQVATSNQS